MDGPNGMAGTRAARHVALELKRELEHAPILLLLAAASIVPVPWTSYKNALFKNVVSCRNNAFIAR